MEYLKKIYQIILSEFWCMDSEKISQKKLTKRYQPTLTSFDQVDYLNQIQLDYHYTNQLNRGLIEPQTGWFLSGRTIIAESYAFWINTKSGWPPLPSLTKYMNPFKKVREVEKAVSFHYGWDNYYHFFIDTLPQIKYWQSIAKKDVVWIVPAKTKTLKYVQNYLELDPLFHEQKVIYQSSEEYIRITKEAHFIKRSRVKSIELFSCIDLILSSIEKTVKKENRKIFLIRKGYRTASNLDALMKIAVSHGFETIRTDQLSLTNQVQLFASTRWLIGFHGAGLTNMIFRKDQKLSLLELFSESKIPLHYWHLTLDFAFNYSYLIGDSYTNSNEQYSIEPELFSNAITRMINEDPNLTL